ncbi:MAG: Nif3-like dinuclear metal center hexameric protein [bacterium]|nr:Nif3-like dinuclear metal center hexameric protein [bacterium]
MVERNIVTSYLHELLPTKSIEDPSWNGLQVEGKESVQTIVVGVTAGKELFSRAIDVGADYIVVHHGHFWKYGTPALTGWEKRRIDMLLDHKISLYASHLPLDKHPEIGNNSQILQLLHAEITGDFVTHGDETSSYTGMITRGKHIEEITEILEAGLETTCIALPFGPPIIRTVAVCSGSGGYKAFAEALDKKVDLFITGDTAEIYNDAKDSGTNVIFAGHHASERLGIKALGQLLQKTFEIKVEFIDVATGL